jgi:hypothetical protein
MNTSIVLRSSTPADVPLLERWDRQPHVISATTDDPGAEKAFEDAYLPPILPGSVTVRARRLRAARLRERQSLP